jgi:hypothetical protein
MKPRELTKLVVWTEGAYDMRRMSWQDARDMALRASTADKSAEIRYYPSLDVAWDSTMGDCPLSAPVRIREY